MTFQFLASQMTCVFLLLQKSHYVSTSELYVSVDVHLCFGVQVLVSQKSKTCKNFVKHTHWSPSPVSLASSSPAGHTLCSHSLRFSPFSGALRLLCDVFGHGASMMQQVRFS